MYFDSFDICEAWYLWLSFNHGGQGSREYQRLSKMTRYFRPSPFISYDRLSENGKEIYDGITARAG